MTVAGHAAVIRAEHHWGKGDEKMPVPDAPYDHQRSQQIDYWLRRAEQESIAAIRSTSAIAAQRHDTMAQAYSARARSLLS